MTGQTPRSDISSEKGMALMYMAVTMTTLLLVTGLAVDGGRGYVVKAQLTKAVDGAALGAARALNSGNPRDEAVRIFKANFPPGYIGTNPTPDPTAAGDFYDMHTDVVTGINTVTIRATAVLPTTFMRLGNFHEMTVSSAGEAVRRMVDLSLVMDVSSSIGWRWPYVRDSAKTFVNAFDQLHDRISLIFFGNGAQVLDPMNASRGFNKTQVISHIPNGLPGGSTNMVEGLYRGWDELRTVPAGQQSGLRIIVLFTDGATNSVPANYTEAPGLGRSLRTWDFPDNGADPDNQTHANPNIDGLYNTATGNTASPYASVAVPWNSTTTAPGIPLLPLTGWQANHRSSGIPTTFPLQVSTLRVNGAAQNAVRGLRHPVGARYPTEVFNINNAARNLVEIIADAARNDNGDYRIRLYTLGMGELVTYQLGTIPEPSSDILKRMANDRTSQDFNSAQLEGKYFFAQTPSDMGRAFQGIQNQIIRLTK